MTTSIHSVHENIPAVAVRENLVQGNGWRQWQKFAFRLSFIFFALLIIPLDKDWYFKVFNVSTLFDLFYVLMGYRPDYVDIATESGRWGVASYSTLYIALGLAVIGASIWSAFVNEGRRKSYNQLLYWLNTAIRYRIALGIIAFGFIKFYPVQMPYPALSSLNNNFGDFSGYKIYWHSVGLVPWYQVFLGVVEVGAGTLLFFRRTVFIGALLNAAVLYNIAHANHAYDGGVHVYSGMLCLMSVFLLVPYVPVLWKLWVTKLPVRLQLFYPIFTTPWKKRIFYGAKFAIVFCFLGLYGYLRYDLHYVKKETKEPTTPAIAGITGFYNVDSFSINGKELPYSPLDSVRWHNAIFEKYSTFVYQVNKPLLVPQTNGSRQVKDVDRNYELTGVAGGHKFYYYEWDEKAGKLKLYDKSAKSEARENRELMRNKANKTRKPDLVFHYTFDGSGLVTLQGLLDKSDTLKVVLRRADKRYAVQLSNQ